MASIINAGSGSNAELAAPYTTQASQHSLLFGVGGEADTKFPLPTGSSWVVVELHFIEANESTIAYTEWFDKLNDISARLIEIQDAIEADPLITNYKMVASHYDHTVANKVDVYRGEHLDGSARVDIVLDSSNVDFTFPIGNWKLSDTVLAPEGVSPNLIEGGTFESQSMVDTYWTVYHAIATHEAIFEGQPNCVKVTEDGPFASIYQDFPTEIGETYNINMLATYDDKSGGDLRVFSDGFAEGFGDLINLMIPQFWAEIEQQQFVATTTTTTIALQGRSGWYACFDDATVRKA